MQDLGNRLLDTFMQPKTVGKPLEASLAVAAGLCGLAIYFHVGRL